MARNRALVLVLFALCVLTACREQPTPRATPIALPTWTYTPTPVRVPTPSPTPPDTAAVGNIFTAPAVTSGAGGLAVPTPPDPPPVGNNAGSAIVGNGANYGVASNSTPGPTPSPTPTPSATFAPKMITYADYGGTSASPSPTQAQNWYTYLQDINSVPVSIATTCTAPCHPIHYMDIFKAEANFNGNDSAFPYHSTNGNYNGTCPGSAGANFFTAGIDDETWYLHAVGTSASIPNRIASFLSTSATTYIWMMNPGSVTLQHFVANTVANCKWNNVGTPGIYYPYSKYGVLLDNTKWRPSIGWSEWYTNEYNYFANVGPSALSPPYAAGSSCPTLTALYSGTYCTSSSPLSSNGLATLEYGTNDAQFITDMNTLLSGMKRNAVDGGGCETIFFNGFFSADPSILANPCITGGLAERVNVDGGSHGSQGQMESLLDGLAMVNTTYPTKQIIVEDTASSTIGTAAEELWKRMHYASIWVGGYPNIVDQPWLDTGLAGANYIFPASYLVPQWSSAYQTMATPGPIPCGVAGYPLSSIYGGAGKPCTSGGVHDSIVCHGTAPNCFLVREFAHCSYNANFDSTTAGVDLGPCAVGWNLTSGSVAESTFSSYFAHWSSYSHVIAFCGTPNSSYITGGTFATGTTVVGTGCGDTANGGGMNFTTLLKSSFTGSLAQYDAIFLIQ